MTENCALCHEPRRPKEHALRPCAECGAMVAVCWLCGDGKDGGAVRLPSHEH